MIHFTELLENDEPATERLTLAWDLRCRSRFAARLDSGRECGVVLPRGTTLPDGSKLRSMDGTVALVCAAPEELSVVYGHDHFSLLRATYHLGNRHVPLEVRTDSLAYQHDHVLDDMVRELGLMVAFECRPFQPESGAYRSGAGHQHSHGHRHSHSHHHHGHHSHDDGTPESLDLEDAPDTHRTPSHEGALQ